MATPQWVLLQRRIEPTQKSLESRYERNARKRQKEAVRSAVRRGFLKHLDQQMILESVADPGVVDLDQVAYISLPASSIQSIDELAILSFSNLCVVNLNYNYLTDLFPFRSCVNLIKLDVSGNQICNVPEASFWIALQSLKILYLNNNMISGKESLFNLSQCKSLQILTMYDNPISLLPNYRHIAVNCILSLKALDYHVISDEEIIENLHLSGKFRSFAKPFRRLLYLPVNKDDKLVDELRKIYELVLCIDSVLAHHSPVIIIQRWVRGWLTRNRLLKCNVPRLKAIVQHRDKGIDHVNKVLRKSSRKVFVNKRQEGRLGTSDLPIPPPCSPIPTLPLDIYPLSMETKTESQGPTTIQVNRTIKETKVILGKNTHLSPELQKKKKKGKKKVKSDILTCHDDDAILSVHGEHQSVSQINKVDHLRDMKIKDANEIREAETAIKKTVTETKRNTIPVVKQSNPWIKDTHSFIRAHATMSLGMLRDISRRQCSLRRESEVTKKAAIVARVKEERETRKRRIQENQQILKDAILDWRDREERRLQEKKEQNELEHEEYRLKRAESIEMMAETIKNRREGENLATTFSQQHNSLDKMLRKGQTESVKVSQADSQKERVQVSRITAQEQAELVSRYMKLRQEKLRSDNSEEKEKLNAQMIQLASQKLMEAKQKVARVKAWKNIAKSLKADITQPNTNNLDNAFESIPEADAVDIGLLGPLLKAYTSIGLTSGYSPQSMRRMTSESHRTWQRGCLGMQEADEEERHFPKLEPLSDHQPLMYDQLHPSHPYFHVGTTPCNSYQATPSAKERPRENSPVMFPPDDLHLVNDQFLQDRLNLMVD